MGVSESFIPADPVLIDDDTIQLNIEGKIYATLQIDEDSIKEDVEGKMYVDFTVYDLPTFDSEPIFALELIELQANLSLAPLDHDTLIAETFDDADGYVDLVNIGETDATFDAGNKEYYGDFAPVIGGVLTEQLTFDLSRRLGGNLSGTYAWASQRFQIPTTKNIGAVKFYGVAITGSPTDMTVRIETNGAGNKPSGTLVHANATCTQTAVAGTNTFVFPSFSLTGTTSYHIVTKTQDTEGVGNYVNAQYKNNTNPYANGERWESSDGGSNWSEGVGDDWKFGVYEFGSAGADVRDIVIDLPAISGTITHTQLIVRDDLETGNTVTYKLYDGTNTDDDLALDTKNVLVNVVGTGLTGQTEGLTIHINKGAGGSSDTPEVKTFCLKLWKEA